MFWKNVDVAYKLFDLFNLLHDYCIWGLGCYTTQCNALFNYLIYLLSLNIIIWFMWCVVDLF